MSRCLERSGLEKRVDHRSHAERGLEEQPTIHEGVAARAMEQKGIISDRCELNRQIKAENVLLRELKSLVKKLMDAVKNTIPAIAEGDGSCSAENGYLPVSAFTYWSQEGKAFPHSPSFQE